MNKITVNLTMLRAIVFTFIGFCLMSCDIGKLDFFSALNQSDADIFLPQPIEDFTLLDHEGVSHQLTYYDDASAIVIMVHGNGCPIVRNGLADFKALQNTFESKNIRFFMLNSNLQDTRESIAAEVRDWGITVPVLVDKSQLIGESLQLSRTSEVLIIDPKNLELVYRGPLSDRLSYESQKNEAEINFVADALDNFLMQKDIQLPDQAVKGCLINFTYNLDKNQAPISYANTIAPLLIEKCHGCHNDKGIGPWSMSSYAMIKGFSPMIREVIRLKRMPPWDADPEIGNWSNDINLSTEEKRALVHWIESGSPRGEGEDPLQLLTAASDDWKNGPPGLILDVPKFIIPAKGNLPYRYVELENPLEEDVWVTAADVKVGDPKSIHHLYAGISNTSNNRTLDQRTRDNFLVAWAPGSELGNMPEGMAVRLKKGDKIFLEIHYVTYGKLSIEQTQLALYFSTEPPKKIMRYTEMRDMYMQIPANTRHFSIHTYHIFDRDAYLLMLTPHSHYRGKSAQFSVEYPDGTKELILSVPNYDYNWQITYHFDRPKALPSGSILHYETIFDNSVFNEHNPDPNRHVPWGEQLHDEMHYAPITFFWADETPENIIHNPDHMENARLMGALDSNLDYYLERSEIPKKLSARFYKLFFKGDKDSDNKLDHRELMSIAEN